MFVVVRTPPLKIFSPGTELNPSHSAIQALTANIMKPASYYHVLETSKKSITAKQGLEQMLIKTDSSVQYLGFTWFLN